MALDPSIILRGQPLDVVGAMRQGNAAAMETNALRQQNQLANVYQTQGAAIMRGDQNALAGVAALDPGLAQGFQMNSQTMAQNTRKMEILNAEEKRAIADAAAQMDAAQKEAAIAEIEGAVKMGLAIQSPEQWDSMMAQNAPELVGQFGNRQALAQKYMTMAEALKASQGPEAISPNERFKVVGSTLFDLGAEGGPAPVGQGAMPEETIMGPDGKPLIIRGGPGSSAKFTEAQAKDNVYATRAEGALAAFEPVAEALTSYQQSGLEAVPFKLGRGMQTDEFQQARQAGRELLAVLLRKDTGAAVTVPEENSYGEVFLPQPGDGTAVLEQKRVARIRAVEAVKAGMNPDQILAVGRALLRTETRSGVGQPDASGVTAGAPVAPQAGGELTAEDLKYLEMP